MSSVRTALLSSSLLALAALANPVAAQDVVLDADAKPYGSTSRTTLVRAGSTLYSLSIEPDGQLLLLSSADGGKNWKDTGFVFNDKNSGIGSGTLTNYCCLAVDSRGWLHASWRRAAYPSFYSQYYRNVNPLNTSQGSAIVDVQTNVVKQSVTTRSAAMGLAVDSQGYVWMLATGAQWISQLLRSDQQYATGTNPTFTGVGQIQGSGGASQNPFLAIDSNDVVHCLFHYASGTRSPAHNAYDPATKSWSGVVRLGTPANNNCLAATDRLGNVHALYGVGSGPYQLEYRRWDATNGWTSPLQVTSFTAAQLGTSNSQWIFTIAAHPVTGDAVILFRDFANGGALVVQKKALSDAAFSHVTTVEPASTAKNIYFMPNVRGSLHPFPTNGALCELDLVYQDRSGTMTRQVFHRLNLCSVTSTGTACKGTNGTPMLSYGELARVGRPFSIDLSSARASTGVACFMGLSGTTWNSIPLPLDMTPLGSPGCSLYTSIDWIFPAASDAQGESSLPLTFPNDPGLAGIQLYNQYLVLDIGANSSGLVMSQGGSFTISL